MIEIKLKGKIFEVDMKDVVWWTLRSLVQIWRWEAIQNAPVLTWNLRRSITTKVSWDKWFVWTNLKYWKKREFINKKNPHRTFFMKKAKKEINENMDKVFTKNLIKRLKSKNIN